MALIGASRFLLDARFGTMDQRDLRIGDDGLHESVRHTDRDVEVAQVTAILGVDEFLDVGMVAAQHAHLRAAPGAGRLDRFAGTVKHAHVAHRPGGAALGAADPGAARPDAREVIADAAAAAHGLRRFHEGDIDAGVAVVDMGDGVAHRLHKAVDQRGGEFGAGRRLDAPGRQKALLQGLQEAAFPLFALLRRLDLRQGMRHALVDVEDVLLGSLSVFLQQNLLADGLGGKGIYCGGGFES